MEKNVFLLLILFTILFACKTTGDVVETTTTTTVVTQDETTDVVVTTTSTTTTSTTTTTLQILDERLQFKLDDSLGYSALERKIKNLFLTIEDKIANQDFEGWFVALSDNYRRYLSDPKELQTISKRSQYLQNKKITLTTPKEYFENVVIIAREGQKLEYRGYKKINNQSLIVYNGIAGYDMNYQYKFIYEKDGWHLDK